MSPRKPGSETSNSAQRPNSKFEVLLPGKLIGSAIIIFAFALCVLILTVGSGVLKFNLIQNSMSGKNIKSPVELVVAGKAVLIDVRTDEEWNAGRALGATHFELAKLQKGESPPVPKGSAIYTYCRSGGRAGQAKTILEQRGYADVTNLGGLANWQELGGAVVK